MSKQPRLTRLGTVDLPVVEASGLTTRIVGDETRLMVIGDRSARIAAATVGPEGLSDDWDIVDVSTLEGWPDFGASSQFEAIAADNGPTVAILREDPPVVLVADTRTLTVRARIELTAPEGSPLHGKWVETPNSRGEGLVLLRHGRLLVAKEKHPAALVEFCPIGTAPRGLSADDFLGTDEEWEAPDGQVEYVAAAAWRLRKSAKKALRDLSALGVGGDRSLWLLSDKSRSAGRVALDPPLRPDGEEILELAELWRLPKGTTKPEGLAVLDDARLLIAVDTDSTHRNGVIVGRPTRQD